MLTAQDSISTRPYLIRALYEWCTDNGFTPHLVVRVNDSVQVPREYVHNGEIVLNVSYDAISALQLGNDFIEFKARFGGEARDIMIPVRRVVAIYARENGQGMAFPLEEDVVVLTGAQPPLGKETAEPPPPSQAPGAKSGPVVQLQSVDSRSTGDDDDNTPPPRRPPPTTNSGARPFLKRVK